MSVTRFVSIVVLSCLVSPGLGQAADQKSLQKCQDAAAREIGKYAAAYQKAVAKCSSAIAKERIRDASEDAAGAARSCSANLSKIDAAASKASERIRQACDPDHPSSKARHTTLDVLGKAAGATVSGDAIEAAALGEWCANFGVGGGEVASVEDWIDCQVAAAECGARQQLAAEIPNLLAWLSDVRTDVEVLALAGDDKAAGALFQVDSLLSSLDGNGDDELDLSCGPLTGGCGNGTVELGEICDGDDFAGETCASRGFNAGGNLACTSDCLLDASECEAFAEPPRFIDNGDGTATDVTSRLMWEVKDGSGSLHGTNTSFTWCADVAPTDNACDDPTSPPDGTLYSLFLDTLNNKCDDDEETDCTANGDADCVGAPDSFASNDLCGHAGHRDWRIPTILELKSILLEPNSAAACSTSPCIDPSMPGSTAGALHWSRTTAPAAGGISAWNTRFSDGNVGVAQKVNQFTARAVRGGT